MSTAILSGQGLQKYFQTRRGVIRAVDGVDFEMREGEVLGWWENRAPARRR